MQESEVREILESGILEEYALGMADAADSRRVERMLAQSHKVQRAYEEVQKGLENFAREGAQNPPADLRAKILRSTTENSPVKTIASLSSQGNKAVIRRMNRIVVAASIALFAIAAVAIKEWNRASHLEQELSQLQLEYDALEESMKLGELQLAALDDQYNRISDPATQKITLTGGAAHEDFVVVAYWNGDARMSYLSVESQPTLSPDECFQLWVDVDGEMVSLGVIPNSQDLVPLKYFAGATSLNVTIEPKGGSVHPNVSRLVVSKPITS